MKLTRAQAHRLIELDGYTGSRGPVVARLTSGEPVSWVAQDRIDRLTLRLGRARRHVPRSGNDSIRCWGRAARAPEASQFDGGSGRRQAE